MRVLVLGARAPVALEWIRSLSKSGHMVFSADSMRYPIARFSRYNTRHFLLPPPRTKTKEWAFQLRRIVMNYSIDLVIPTCEEIFYLSFNKSTIGCPILAMDFDLLKEIHHKGHFASMTKDWPIQAPESYVLVSEKDIASYKNISKDWVFKPCYSRFATLTLISPDQRDLDSIQPTKEQPWLAQKRVSGTEFCTYSILSNGILTAHSCYQPRYRVGKGSGVFFEPYDFPEITHFVEHFGKALNFTGQVGFDFIRDKAGRFHVLECNPRGTSGAHLIGENLASCLKEKSGRQLQSLTPKMVGLAMILFGWSNIPSFTAYVRDFFRAQDVLMRKDDIATFFSQPIALGEIIIRSVKGSTGLLKASTIDIEWDGEQIEA